jgi:uncharacterized protein YkwD
MKFFKLLTILLLLAGNGFSQSYPDYHKNGKKEWTSKEWRSANTARFAFYMGRQTRNSIRFMNLARMYGPKFSKIYIEPIEKKSNYENSLIRTLNAQKYIQPLRPSPNLWGAALTHAIVSGFAGTTGHQGYATRFAIFQPFSYGANTAENCDYGARKGLDITLDLIIDKGVPSLGHRKTILDSELARVGGARFFHTKYGWNAVFDYSSPKWLDLILYRKSDILQTGLNVEISQISNKPFANIGFAVFANHLETTDMMIDINYQYGFFTDGMQGVNVYVGTGSNVGLATNFLIGLKTSTYFPEDAFNLYLQPTISYFSVISFFRNGYLFEQGDFEHSAIYRLSYGYNFNVTNNRNANIYRHNFTLSRFISLTSKNNTKRRKR